MKKRKIIKEALDVYGVQRFCVHGHDTSICGRNTSKGCNECHRLVVEKAKKRGKKLKVGRSKGSIPWNKGKTKRICKRGHDTLIVGRNKYNQCTQCDFEYYLENREQILAKVKAYNALNRQEKIEYLRKYYDEHKEEFRLHGIEYREIHQEDIKEYRETNREKLLKQRRENVRRRHLTDPVFRLQRTIRTRLKCALKNNQKTGSAIEDLGCPVEFFKEYLEDKFYAGMTWDNYGKYWQIDHIIPLRKFDLTDRKQLLKAINYKNMQPLTITDHKKKTAKETREWAESQYLK